MDSEPPSRPVSAATTSKIAHQRSHNRADSGIPQRPPSRRVARLPPIHVPPPPAGLPRAPSVARTTSTRPPSVVLPGPSGTRRTASAQSRRPPSSRPATVVSVSRPASVTPSLKAPSAEHTPGTATTIKAPTPQRPADLTELEHQSHQSPVPPSISQVLASTPDAPAQPVQPPPSQPPTRVSSATPSSLSPLYSPASRHLYRGPSDASWGEESQHIFNQGVVEYADEHPSIFEFFQPGDREPTDKDRYLAEQRGMRMARTRFYAEQTATRDVFENQRREKERVANEFRDPSGWS